MRAGKPERAGCVWDLSPRAEREGRGKSAAGMEDRGARGVPPEVVVAGWKVERCEVERARYEPPEREEKW